MKVPITKETMKAVYSMYRDMPPFNKWGLPKPDNVQFVPMKSKSLWGQYVPIWIPGVKFGKINHRIRIAKDACFKRLLKTMPHEMIHLRQQHSGMKAIKKDNWHDKDFKKMAKQICKRFGFPMKKF